MPCPKCHLGYMLHHPQAQFSHIWRKCVTCGYCHKVGDLKLVESTDDEAQEEEES